MSRLEIDGTSAAGAMFARQVLDPILVGCIFFGIGTSSASALPPDVVRCPVDQTSPGPSIAVEAPSGSSIGELRRLSGLTWDQLARLFSVSRRSLHFWASGGRIAPSNEERLQRLLAVVRNVDRGTASINRAMLLGAREDGSLPYDLLVAGEYERVLSLLGSGDARRISPSRLSDEERALRAPPPAEELVSALQDRIHPASGRILSVKAIPTPRRR